MDGRPWRGPPGGLKQWLVCQVLHSSRQKRRGPCASAKLESIREFQNHATARPYSLHLTWSSFRFFLAGFLSLLDKPRVQYICTLHFCTTSTGFWTLVMELVKLHKNVQKQVDVVQN